MQKEHENYSTIKHLEEDKAASKSDREMTMTSNPNYLHVGQLDTKSLYVRELTL